MPDISSLSSPASVVGSGGESGGERTSFEATVIIAPTDEDQELYVIIEDFSDVQHFGPCRWSPVIISELQYAIPAIGDRGLVTISNDEEVWMIEWWPYAD